MPELCRSSLVWRGAFAASRDIAVERVKVYEAHISLSRRSQGDWKRLDLCRGSSVWPGYPQLAECAQWNVPK